MRTRARRLVLPCCAKTASSGPEWSPRSPEEEQTATAPGETPRGAVFIYIGTTQRLGNPPPKRVKSRFDSERPCEHHLRVHVLDH
jgi:hypothetical protein